MTRPSSGSGAQVQAQASYLACMDAFRVLMLISLSAVPLAVALRRVKLGGQSTWGIETGRTGSLLAPASREMP
jgi:hypothetical protein